MLLVKIYNWLKLDWRINPNKDLHPYSTKMFRTANKIYVCTDSAGKGKDNLNFNRKNIAYIEDVSFCALQLHL